ncbi:MAG: hypothetical protein HN837_02040 [Chloroflexi bacterium]|jgi:Tol biopolymer transport system component|nr:hypothetical protein [Chloroflexota bacterium]MBT7289264.1 hypothetical protein [Chloroflexota bacterium]
MPVIMFEPDPEPEDMWPITSYHNGNWNPDNFIALDRPHDRDIYIMNGDGSEPVNLTKDITTNYFLADLPSEIGYMMFTHPQWSPDGSKILFWGSAYYEPTYYERPNQFGGLSSGYDREVADSAYYVMDSDGSNIIRVIDSGYDRIFWSPDGKITVVYIDKDYVANELTEAIVAMDADGSNLTELFFEITPDGRTYNRVKQVYWSPDGSKLAFIRDDHLYTLNKDGSDLKVLNSDENKINTYSWSPDSSKIGYGISWEFYLMNADGSNLVAVYKADSATMRLEYSRRWSADGSIAVYHFNNYLNYFVYADGSIQSIDHRDNGWSFISPDGSKVAFEQSHDVYVMNVDESDKINLTDNDIGGSFRRWSADGSQIYVKASSAIYAIDTDGSNVIKIIDNPAGESTIVKKYYWSPDNSKILADIENRDTFEILTSE